MSAPNLQKGARYIGNLDSALYNGSWPEVPEWARKVDKHAPERSCLTLAARSEAQIASASHRPTSASSTASTSIHGLGQLVKPLNDAIAAETRHPEDAYAASVCLAEIHWLREEPDEALRALRGGNVASSGSGHVTALGWGDVCDTKAVFLKGAALEAKGEDEEARQLYLATILRAPGSRTPEMRRWTERLLGKAAMFMWRRAEVSSTSSLSEALRCFLSWDDFWQRAPSNQSTSGSHTDVPRRQIWRAHYDLLSAILQHGYIHNATPSSSSDLLLRNPEHLNDEEYTTAKQLQRTALKRVATSYESLLLNETQFPKAGQSNPNVEAWVQQVIANWRLFTSSDWTDAELGHGGREAVARDVLDILYRASTKTFHSTSILRQLFTVHASLGDFDLAMHAFDSYVEIMSKGKARAEKTGKRETGFDSDDDAVLTAAEAVKMLCQYGDHEQAERANEVVKTLMTWLGLRRPGSSATQVTVNGDDSGRPASSSALNPKTMAAAYHAFGLARGHWARVTYDNDSRPVLRTEAINYLKRAQMHDPESLEIAFGLAYAMAEAREMSSAVQVAKRALAPSEDDSDDEDSLVAASYSREKDLIPIWHLLALCMTGRDEYEQAAGMCEAALDQFGDPTILFGVDNIQTSFDTANSSPSNRGIVDQMDACQRQGLLQLKMTQITLVELMEGSETAVGLSQELLGLYARLFGSVEQSKSTVRPFPTAASATPTKTGGTLRSIAGSIRPRSRANRPSVENDTYRPPPSILEEPPPNSGNMNHNQSPENGAPISITVTNEDGVAAEKQHHHHHHPHLPFKLRGHHGDSRSVRSSKSYENLNEKPLPAAPNEGKEAPTPMTINNTSTPEKATHNASNGSRASPDQPIGEMAHSLPANTWPAPTGHKDQPPRQDVRLPTAHPASSGEPQRSLSSLQERQHKITLIVGVWLFIAGVYLRAGQPDDAAGAVDEAFKLVERFEVEVGNEKASARNFFEKGWGLGKSVDALWGDVWAAKGDLATARDLPFEAMFHYENALNYSPDHIDGVIGLSTLLMDIYEQKLPPEEPQPSLLAKYTSSSAFGSTSNTTIPPAPRIPQKTTTSASVEPPPASTKPQNFGDPDSATLNRLACRDRAYMLLNTVTKLDTGWDHAAAWLTLARSHELSKQVGRAKKALWWVVELEESRPVRHWDCV